MHRHRWCVMEQDYLLISGIQHFCFCKRQWGLIHIENSWNENRLTAEGRLLHDRVHQEDTTTKRNGIITLRGLRIRSERLMIAGACDAVELIPDEEGITLSTKEGRWRIHPVEYKRGKSKTDDSDRLQLAAECICLEEMLSCRIEEGSLFYGETRHRECVMIDDSLRKRLESIVAEMMGYYQRKYTPRVKSGQYCNNCSLKDICLPKLMKTKSVSEYIAKHIHEDSI